MVPKHSSSFSLSSRKRREFFLTPRKALPTVGDTVPDPIISIASQLNSSLGRLDGTSLRVPRSFLWKYSISIIYGYIDGVLMTNPCQWGRGA